MKQRSFFGCSAYRDGCRIICDNNNGKPGPVIERTDTPSAKQIAYAQSIARHDGLSISDETLGSSKALHAWIDQACASMPVRPASDAQRHFIADLIEQKQLKPPKGWPDALMYADASAFITEHYGGKTKSSATRKRKPVIADSLSASH